MRYPINKENYHRFDILSINKLPPRSYFIPFASRAQADSVTPATKRYASTKVRCLNGQWDFKFYPIPSQLPDVLDTDGVQFDTIDVPSCWQFRGYDRPFYLNTRYQFPFAPPNIPKEEPVGRTFSTAGSDLGIKPRWQTPKDEYNFVGVYRTYISVEDTEKTRILSFLGVASCVDVYVNGSFAGYSEGSHNTAEFDITQFLRVGENELLAVVHRWCTGTYLECQDMLRNNGIFRDVLLYEMDETDFWDVDFSAVKSEGLYTAAVRAELNREGTVKITLSGHGLEYTQTVQSEGKTVQAVFEDLHVQQWTAETPVLYDLYFELEGSCVKLRVGFKVIQIEGDVFTFNSQKIKLRGINHHDTSCCNGYTLSPQEIEQDIRLCKAYYIDTVRTSHYPPDPMLLEWCDELGIYVVDEADIETHGAFTMQIPPNFHTITHDSAWEGRYVERARHLYERDKTHACITLWSLGNEAGGYRNTDAMYAWLKQRTQIPIHYESVVHSKAVAYDVGSEMYPTVDMVEKVGQHRRRKKKLNDRPYFLCEYAHAMGVGPGAVEEYWQRIYRYDNLMGGCVWEMVDHAVLHADGRYTYGGDHGEWMHDSNFCVDGMFYPDRSPSTGAKIIRHVYRPIRVQHVEGCRYEIFNTTNFSNADNFTLRFSYPNGYEQAVCVKIPPLMKQIVELPQCPEGQTLINVTVRDNRTGREVSTEQLVFDLPVCRHVQRLNTLPDWVDFQDGVLVFCKDGKVMSVGQQHTVLFRAPTDNDRNMLLTTAMDDFVVQREQVERVSVLKDKLVVNTKITCRKQIFSCTDTYESCSDGILVTSQLHCIKGGGKLPRFGKTYRLDASFDDVTYFGRNCESYCDMKEHAQIAAVSCKVSDMTEPNIKPQESGNRCDCSWAQVSDSETAFRFVAVEKPFELGIKPYSDWELLSMKHREDEIRTGTYVTVSAFQMGIGTGSCGPATLPQYTYDAKQDYTLQFIIQ